MRLRSVMSVFVPYQRMTRPSASRNGLASERNQRYSPVALRRGKVSFQGSPALKACEIRSTTRSTWSGWWTAFQPQPFMESMVVPV